MRPKSTIKLAHVGLRDESSLIETAVNNVKSLSDVSDAMIDMWLNKAAKAKNRRPIVGEQLIVLRAQVRSRL